MEWILSKIRSVQLCLMAHPDNEEGSEFEDRISDLEEMQNKLSLNGWIDAKKETPKLLKDENSTPPTSVLIDGDGQKLNVGDRVFTYDAFAAKHARVYGTLYKNSDYPNVSDYYVSYDDGEDCAVLDFGMLFKA